MRAHPVLIGGEGATDTELMRAQPEWLAKAGAEGLMCAASHDGIGLAVKVADGNGRALRPALAAFGPPLGLELPDFAEVRAPELAQRAGRHRLEPVKKMFRICAFPCNIRSAGRVSRGMGSGSFVSR